MSFLLLTETTRTLSYENLFLIKQLAWVFGKIMDGIMIALNAIGIHNIALCIVLFSIITQALLLPLTIKSQKSTRISSFIQPELKKIQEKYKGRTDSVSQQKMLEEQQALQQRYGVSMTAGCLPMLIQMPILFALYPVVYNMEAHVDYLSVLKAQLSAEEFSRMYTLFGLNLQEAPGFKLSWALIIPVLVGASQYAMTKITMSRQNNAGMEGNAGGVMKAMNLIMPLFLAYLSVNFPGFLGLYWIVRSVLGGAQTMLINRSLDKIGMEELIRQNIEKQNAKRAKKGLPPLGENATRTTRNIIAANQAAQTQAADREERSEERAEKIRQATEYYNSRNVAPGSLAAKANMVREYNEKNEKKR